MTRSYGSVSPKGQVTIPAEMRELLGLKPKDRVEFECEDGVVKVRRAESQLKQWRGAAGKVTSSLTVEEMVEIAWEDHLIEWARKDTEQHGVKH